MKELMDKVLKVSETLNEDDEMQAKNLVEQIRHALENDDTLELLNIELNILHFLQRKADEREVNPDAI